MVIINKQLDSTNKNYCREKNYYVSINYHKPNNTTQKIYSRHKEKTYIKSNISGALTYSKHRQTSKMELSVKTINS